MTDRVLIEKVEVLNGDRRGAQGRAAVRREDLARLAGITRRAKAVQNAPTADDFNALLADIDELIQTLTPPQS